MGGVGGAAGMHEYSTEPAIKIYETQEKWLQTCIFTTTTVQLEAATMKNRYFKNGIVQVFDTYQISIRTWYSKKVSFFFILDTGRILLDTFGI